MKSSSPLPRKKYDYGTSSIDDDDISADSWFAIIYTVIAEITPVEIHGVTTAMFLFILNNIAGNLPVVVAPLSGSVGLRGALFIMSPMLVGVSKLSEMSLN